MSALYPAKLAFVVSALLASHGSLFASDKFELTTETQFICEADAGPIRTACEELQKVIKRLQPKVLLNDTRDQKLVKGAIVIGTSDENGLIRDWMSQGKLDIRGMPSSGDAFESAFVDGALVVTGSNPGSVIDAVHTVQELIKDHEGIPHDTHLVKVSPFNLRVLHPRHAARGGFHEFQREDFSFIRRSGGNAVLLTHDWMKEKFLHSFVASEAFPAAIDAPELERNRESLRRYISWADEYGLKVVLWICAIPCQGGPWKAEPERQAFLERYPRDVLEDTGTYQGLGLCLAHPKVQSDLQQMVRSLLTEYPQVSFIQIVTLDSDAEFCSPEKCPRHHGISKIEQRNDLIELILAAGHPLRPDLHVLTISWGWQNEPGFLDQQRKLPAGAGLFSTADGEAWSCDRKITDRLAAQRDVCRQHGQLFLGYDIFFWGDDILFPPSDRLYDFPYGIGAKKMRRWAWLQADGVFDQWGTAPELMQSNAFALREFSFDPLQPIEPVVERIARRQFGKAAPHVLEAWREIEAAQQLQSDHTYYWHNLRPTWAVTTLGIPPTVEKLSALTEIPGNESWKTSGSIEYVPQDEIVRAQRLGIASRRIVKHLNAEVVALERAQAELAPFDRSFYADLLNEVTPLTPADQLANQHLSVRMVFACQREIGHFCEAFALVKQMAKASGDEHRELEARYRQLREDTLDGTRQFLELLEEREDT